MNTNLEALTTPTDAGPVCIPIDRSPALLNSEGSKTALLLESLKAPVLT